MGFARRAAEPSIETDRAVLKARASIRPVRMPGPRPVLFGGRDKSCTVQ